MGLRWIVDAAGLRMDGRSMGCETGKKTYGHAEDGLVALGSHLVY